MSLERALLEAGRAVESGEAALLSDAGNPQVVKAVGEVLPSVSGLLERCVELDKEQQAFFEAMPDGLLATAAKCLELEKEHGLIRANLPAIKAEMGEYAERVAGEKCAALTVEIVALQKRIAELRDEQGASLKELSRQIGERRKELAEYAMKVESEIPPAIAKRIHSLFAEIPRPKDGKDGRAGKPGKDASLLTGFTGNWDAEREYKPGETFTFRGSFYLVLRACRGVLPDVKSQLEPNRYYAVLAISGAPGLPGAGTAGGGGGTWGSITGTLSNQTDLQAALDAKLNKILLAGGTSGQVLSKASNADYDFEWVAQSGGGGSGNLDGGAPGSNYGGTTPVDGGTP